MLIGIRGATTVKENTKEEILQKTSELLSKLIETNFLEKDLVASIFFTMTADLNAAFPAVAARDLGYTTTALLCAQELSIVGSLPRCIRILIHYNAPMHKTFQHVYLEDAVKLRDDLNQPIKT